MNNWVPMSSADLSEVELEIGRQTEEVGRIVCECVTEAGVEYR